MFTRAILMIFAWALVLELFVLAYYLWRGTRPVEFYVNLGLLVFTVSFMILLVHKERKRRDKDDERG